MLQQKSICKREIMLSETQGARESRPEQKRTYWCNKVGY